MLLVFAPLDEEATRAGTEYRTSYEVSGSRRGDVLKAEDSVFVPSPGY